jgi:hypothetical protein
MDRYEEEAEDSDNETDPEQLLNEWLGELDSLTVVSLCLLSRATFTVRFTIYKRTARARARAANSWIFSAERIALVSQSFAVIEHSSRVSSSIRDRAT